MTGQARAAPAIETVGAQEMMANFAHRSLLILLLASLGLAACAPREVVTTVEVQVTKEVPVLVTPTPAPLPEGGTLVEAVTSDVRTLNPILANDPLSRRVAGLIYIGLLGWDPLSGQPVGRAAESWEVAADGLTITFHLRPGLVWSDGSPLTAADVRFTLEAIADPAVGSPLQGGLAGISQVDVPDDATVVLHLAQADCSLLSRLTFGILPASQYAADFSDVATSSANQAPSLASGPFRFLSAEPGQNLQLTRNSNYYGGEPHIESWVLQQYPNARAAVEGLLAGEVDLADVPPELVSEVEAEHLRGQPVEFGKYYADGYSLLALNMANPGRPQRGWQDQNGNGRYDPGEVPQPQDSHPILGDVHIRQAIAQALDYQAIINQAADGQAGQAFSNVLPAISWAFDGDLERYNYDPDTARQLLEAAGWTDANGDGIREKDGRRLSLGLLRNADNPARQAIAAIVTQNLSDVGFEIRQDVVDFNTFVTRVMGQTFDLAIFDLPNRGPDPDDSSLWSFVNDQPGAGLNFTSYYNETVEKDLQAAKAVAACDLASRRPFYEEVQRLIRDDSPYVFLYIPIHTLAWNSRLGEIAPYAWSQDSGVASWYLAP
jgi:peptide/nickel transport system substrate-binding protein